MTAEEKKNEERISAAEYIRTTVNSSDRLAVLVRNRSRGETIQRINDLGQNLEPSFQQWLEFKNEKESCDIYVGMNALKPKPAPRTRTKEDIHTIRHLYLDIDHDGPAALAKIQKSNLVPPPNYTNSTSPNKFQVVWRVENVATFLPRARPLRIHIMCHLRSCPRGHRLCSCQAIMISYKWLSETSFRHQMRSVLTSLMKNKAKTSP
jgi:hypothetical protein